MSFVHIKVVFQRAFYLVITYLSDDNSEITIIMMIKLMMMMIMIMIIIMMIVMIKIIEQQIL